MFNGCCGSHFVLGLSGLSTKAQLRKQVLAVRDNVEPAARIEKCLLAAQMAQNHLDFQPGTIISGFVPIRSEIDARPVMDILRKKGARLCLPIVINKTTLEFRELVRGAPMVKAGFGTVGPDENAMVLDPQLMIVPLAAFDGRGTRIGYGAGHYDRAIARLISKNIRPRLIGLAFDCQRVEKIDAEPHDIPLDAIITESGMADFNKENMD